MGTKGLFNLFDFDGRGTINLEEFTDGILHLHGSAKSIDVYLLRRDNQRIFDRLSDLFTLVVHPEMKRAFQTEIHRGSASSSGCGVESHSLPGPMWNVNSVHSGIGDKLRKIETQNFLSQEAHPEKF